MLPSQAETGTPERNNATAPCAFPKLADAPVKIEDRRPTFCVRELAALADLPGHSVRDVAIVRFDKKKDHRELQTTSGGSAFTYKAGFGKEKLVQTTGSRSEDGSFFTITATENVAPGEYLFTFGYGGASGDDFSVR